MRDPPSHGFWSCRCIKLQLGGEAAQAKAWDWLAANQLSALVTTKESR